MKNPTLFSLIVFFLSLTVTSCDKESADLVPDPNPQTISTPAELSAAMEDIVHDTEVPGFAVTIVKNNAILYQEAFGYADIESQIPYTNETVQHIASISKTFVGAAVVKAIEQGYFTLETDINDLLPVEFRNPKQAHAAIKVKHLVTHTSGLLDNIGPYLAGNYYILPGENVTTHAARQLINTLGIRQREGGTLEEFLAEYFLEDGDLYSPDNFANTAPGSTWSYSNVATGLMAYLIETVTEQSFDDYVKVHVLQPLGMSSSTYDITEVDQPRLAKCYLDRENAYPLYANDSYVEGNMFTNNVDLGKYLLNMTQGARGDSEVLFSKSGYDLLFMDQLDAGIVPSDFADNHGIFWIKNGNSIQHGGNDFGVSTYLEIDASGDSGYSLVTNMDATFDYTEYNRVAQLVNEAIGQFIDAN